MAKLDMSKSQKAQWRSGISRLYDRNKELKETERKLSLFIKNRPGEKKTPWWLHVTSDEYFF